MPSQDRGDLAADRGARQRGREPSVAEVVGDAALGQPAEGERQSPGRPWTERLRDQEDRSGDACERLQRAEHRRQEVLIGVARCEHEAGQPLGMVHGDELADRAAGVVADERDALQVERLDEAGDDRGEAEGGEVGARRSSAAPASRAAGRARSRGSRVRDVAPPRATGVRSRAGRARARSAHPCPTRGSGSRPGEDAPRVPGRFRARRPSRWSSQAGSRSRSFGYGRKRRTLAGSRQRRCSSSHTDCMYLAYRQYGCQI